MGKQFIISVSREYGSQGHRIGENLARRLGVEMIDRAMLDQMMRDKGFSDQEIGIYSEKTKKPFFSRTVRGYTNSIEENVAHLQFDYIQEQADTGKSFVVIGRCSEAVLARYPGLISIFVTGDEVAKLEHIMKTYDLDMRDAMNKIKRHDAKRKTYHNSYAPFKWGDSRHYDLLINSSKLGLEKTIDLLEDYCRERIKIIQEMPEEYDR